MCVAPRLREEFEELSAKEVEKSTRGALSATPPQDGPITKRSLRECIPPECFKRSYAKSLGHLAWDLLQVYLTYAAATYAAKCLPSALAPAVWLTYWFCQGLFLTALWVVAHECGHGGFTNSRLLNDLVGFSLHSSLLTPYFSWALTHAKHHHYTNHMSHGETWVPKELDPQKPSVVYAKTPLGTVQRIAIIFTVGWYAYLFNNATGAKQNKGQSHFNPHSRALFKPRDAPFVRASNAGMVAMLAVLGLCVRSFGLGAVVRVYLLPQMVANFYLCAITFMQHTHPDVPHCSPWTQGAGRPGPRTARPFLAARLWCLPTAAPRAAPSARDPARFAPPCQAL